MPETRLNSIPCSACGTTIQWRKPPKSPDRLPQGWKRRAGEVFCGACWRARFILRAVTLPVASPVDCTWEELNAVLHEMWAVTTSASNWMTTEMYVRDARREAGQKAIPPMPKTYLYPEARALFPALPSQSIAALEQAVQKKYRARRREVIWTHSMSLPSYRYPTPFGIPNQGWTVAIENQRPTVSARVGDRRIRLYLKSGPEFARQMRSVRLIISGEAEQGQMDIYRQGRGKDASIMVKMVAWLPRKASQAAEGTLIVRSTPDAILQAFNLKDEAIWTYHGNQLRQWIAEHRKRLQDFADDSKAELRPVPPFAVRRQKVAEKFRHRMATATHEIAAMLVAYAQRRKFAGIEYDDADKSFGEGMPWAELRRKIAEKADAAGIVFTLASGEAVSETPEPLAESKDL